MGIALLKHNPVGKTTHTPGYAASAVRYVMRRSAGNHIYSEHMPRQYHAAQRFIDQREANSRKNARIFDRFHLALPRELSPDQGIELARAFGRRLGQGRAPFLVSVHTDNWEQNPHAHVIFIDADIETGKRVAMTSERGSTRNIKRIWQDVANDHLELAGFERSIDFDYAEQEAKHQRDIADDLQMQDEFEAASTNEDTRPNMEDGDSGVVDQKDRKQIQQDTRDLAGLIATTNFIKEARQKLKVAETELGRMEKLTYERMVAARTDAGFALDAKVQLNDSVKRFDEHRDTTSGRLNGWGVHLFGIRHDSLARREALSHQEEVLKARKNYEFAHQAAEISARVADEATKAVESKQIEIGRHRFNLSVYGEGKELEQVEYLYQTAADHRLTGKQIETYDRAARDGIISERDYLLIRDYHAEMEMRDDVEIELPAERIDLGSYPPQQSLLAEQTKTTQLTGPEQRAQIETQRERLDEALERGEISDEDYVLERVALKEQEKALEPENAQEKKKGLGLGY